MNKIYKVIWSKVRNCYVVVSELAHSNHKSKVKTSLVNRLGGLALSTSILLNLLAPQYAHADIVRKGSDTPIAFDANGIADIYAETRSSTGNSGINRFKEFTLDNGKIANMYFNTEADKAAGTADFNYLFNFVNNDIKINGMVNAIKDNTIGGNLYFFGSNNIIVGSTGVINAGSINLVTPSGNLFNKGYYLDGTSFGDDAEIYTNQYEVNSEGTVEVYGKLNATNNIYIHTGRKIDVKRENDTTDAPRLLTGVKDFSKYVNLSDDQKTALNTKGITLKYAKNDSPGGDITLKVEAYNTNEQADLFGNADAIKEAGNNTISSTTSDGTTSTNDTSTASTNSPSTVPLKHNAVAEINIGEGAELTALNKEKGDISLTATAKLGTGEKLLAGVTEVGLLDYFGMVGNTTATVNVQGKLEASHIGIAANAENEYARNSLSSFGAYASRYLVDALGATFPTDGSIVPFAGDVSWQNSKATVSLTGATLTATGEDTADKKAVSISASSKMDISVGASEEVAARKIADENDTNVNILANNMSKYFSTGVSVAVDSNEAAVTIDGDSSITADLGSVDTNATASLKAMVSSADEAENTPDTAEKASDKGGSAVGIAFGLGVLNNKATVKLEDGNGTINAQKDVNIGANTTSTVIAASNIKGSEDASIAGIAFSWIKLNSEATVEVGKDITAGYNLAITANESSSLAQKVNNGNTKYDVWGQSNFAKWSNVFKEHKIEDYLPFLQKKLTNYIKTKNGNDDSHAHYNHEAVSEYAKSIGIGSSVAVADTKHDAIVTIKNTAAFDVGAQAKADDALAKDGNITIKSNVKTDNVNVSTRTVVGLNGETHDASKEAALSLTISNQDYNSKVIIEGTDGTNNAKLKAAGNVAIDSQSVMEWNQLQNELNLIASYFGADVKTALEAAGLGKDAWALAVTADQMAEYYQNPTSKEAQNWFKALNDINSSVNLKNINASANVIKKLKQGINEIGNLFTGSTYANFSAASIATTSGDASKDTYAKTDFAATGAFIINALDNHANVIIGSGAEIEAGKEVDMQARVQQDYLSLAGPMEVAATGWLNNSSSSSTGIGANVAINYTDAHSTLVVAEDAAITANTLKAVSETTGNAKSIALGGGVSDKNGYTGMSNITISTHNAIALLDDEVKVNIAGAAQINAKSVADILSIGLDYARTQGLGLGASVNVINADKYAVAGIVDIDRDDTDADKYDDKKGKKLVEREGKNVDNLNTLVLNEIGTGGMNQLGSNNNKSTTAAFNTNTLQVASVSGGNIQNIAAAAGSSSGGNNRLVQANNASTTEIDAVGAVAVNTLANTTASLVEDVTLTGSNTTAPATNTVTVNATDDVLLGAYAGSAAWQSMGADVNGANADKYQATLAGAAAVNTNKANLISVLDNTTLKNIGELTNFATKDGAQVAVGGAMGIQLDESVDGKGINVDTGFSYNYSDNTVKADLKDVKVNGIVNTDTSTNTSTNATNVYNYAVDNDKQYAGTLSFDYTKAKYGIGASIALQRLNNTVTSTVNGGKYTGIDNMDIFALSKLIQLTGAASIGIKTGTQSGTAVNAASATSTVTNTLQAGVYGNGTADTDDYLIEANNLSVKATDGVNSKNKSGVLSEREENSLLERIKEDALYGRAEILSSLSLEKIDAFNSRASIQKTSTVKDWLKSLKKGHDLSSQNAKISVVENNDFDFASAGNGTYTIALAGAFTTTSGDSGSAAGAAVSAATLNNTYTSEISNAKVKVKDTLTNNALGDSDVINVAVGAAVKTAASESGISAAGSGSGIGITTNVKSIIQSSKITADVIDANAKNTSFLFNVAGEGDYSGSGFAAGGVTTADNVLHNTTGAYINSSDIILVGDKRQLKLNASNTSTNVAIAAGVNAKADGTADIGGAIAGNSGKNDTEAIIDGKKQADGTTKETEEHSISGAKSVDVKADDTTKAYAIAGEVTGTSSKGAFGGAAAYNTIGSSSDKQKTLAQLTNITYTNADATTINVTADNTSKVQTWAAGLGGNSKSFLYVNGSLARAEVNSLTQADFSKIAKLAAATTDVNVKAKNDETYTTVAGTLSGSKEGTFTGGVGLGLNTLKAEVQATASELKGADDANATLQSLTLDAVNKAEVMNVTPGIAISTGNMSVDGNLSSNLIDNDTTAKLSSSKLELSKALAIHAYGDEKLRNFVGALTYGNDVSGAIGAAFNEITGDVTAAVEGSSITSTYVDDDSTTKKLFDNTSSDSDTKKENVDDTAEVRVVAEGKHDIYNLVLNVAGSGFSVDSIGLAGTGNGASNKINGNTLARIYNTDINAQGNVKVDAVDNSIMTSTLGNGSVAVAEALSASGGIVVDKIKVERATKALVESDKKDDDRNKITAKGLNIYAESDNKFWYLDIGAAAAIGTQGLFSGTLVGVINHKTINATTLAHLNGIRAEIGENGLKVTADHTADITVHSHAGDASVNVKGESGLTINGVLNISVLNDSSYTGAIVNDSDVRHTAEGAQDTIYAHNNIKNDNRLGSYNVLVAQGVGVAATISVGVNNTDAQTVAGVINSSIGKADPGYSLADSITVSAKNELDITQDSDDLNIAVAFILGQPIPIPSGLGASINIGVNNPDSKSTILVDQANLYAKKDITLQNDEVRKITNKFADVKVDTLGLSGNVAVSVISGDVYYNKQYGFKSESEENYDDTTKNSLKYYEAKTSTSLENMANLFNNAVGNTTYLEDNRDAITSKILNASASNMNVNAAANVNKDKLTSNTTTKTETLQTVRKYSNTTTDDIKYDSVQIAASNLYSQDGSISVNSHLQNNILHDMVTRSIGIGLIPVNVNIVNAYNRNKIIVKSNSSLYAKGINLETLTDGTNDVETTQVKANLANISVNYAGALTEGSTGIDISDATLKATGDINIQALDKAETKISIGVYGGTLGQIAASVADARDNTDTTITIDKNNTILAGVDTTSTDLADVVSGTGTLSILANKAGRVRSYVKDGFGSGVDLSGSGSWAEAKGTTKVALGTDNVLKAGKEINAFAANNTDLYAENSNSDGAAVKLNIIIARSRQYAATEFVANDGNTLQAKSIYLGAGFVSPLEYEANPTTEEEIKAKEAAQEDNPTIEALTFAAGGAAVNLEGNFAEATMKGNTTVTIGAQKYNADFLNIYGDNEFTVKSTISYGAGAVAAVGANSVETYTNSTSTVTAKGMQDGSSIKNALINNLNNVTTKGDGEGGAGSVVEVSPVALRVKNTTNMTGAVNVSGDWNLKNNFYVRSFNNEDLTLKGVSTRGTVAGWTGAHLNNDQDYQANLTISGNITSAGNQWYAAKNNLTEDASLETRYYAGVPVQTSWEKNVDNYLTNIKFDNAKLESTAGDIDVEASNTGGSIKHMHKGVIGGLVSVGVVNTDHTVHMNNTIATLGNSSFKTDFGQDITMAAYNGTSAINYDTVAVSNIGLLAFGGVNADVKMFEQSNAVNIGKDTRITSGNDVNLYAGADTTGNHHVVALAATAEVYAEKTVAVIMPGYIDVIAQQKNNILVEGTVDSVVDVNLEAQDELSTVKRLFTKHTWYTSTSNAEEEINAVEVSDTLAENTIQKENKVKVTGSVTAGKYTDLTLTIAGNAKYTISDDGKSVTLDASDIIEKTTALSKGDWFDKNTISYGHTTVTNPYKQRADEIAVLIFGEGTTLATYAKGSAEYTLLYDEYQYICEQMYQHGFAKRTGSEGAYRYDIYNSKEVPAVILPNIRVSGGNVNIIANSLEGDGSITANGAPQINITSSSDVHVNVNDIIIAKTGGQANFKYKDLTNFHDKFTGTIYSDASNKKLPEISITSATTTHKVNFDNVTDDATTNAEKLANIQHLTDADISVNGTLKNLEGAINVTSHNNSIMIAGATLQGNEIHIDAYNGDVVQTSSGLINIGSDPTTRYQFGKDIGEKIQRYFSSLGSNSVTFTSYKAFIEYIKTNLGNATDSKIKLTKADIDTIERIYKNYNAGIMMDENGNAITASKENTANKTSGGIVAGKDVYISGLNVNIDGLIQSGYNKYNVTLDASVQETIKNLKAEYDKEAVQKGEDGKVLSLQDLIAEGSKYKVSGTAEITYDSTSKAYTKNIDVYYNPSTDKLVVPDIETGGGNIFIKGKISSTGNGRIVAASGAADINIDTQAVSKNLELNAITVNNAVGRITLIDTNQTYTDASGVTRPITNVFTEENGVKYLTTIGGDKSGEKQVLTGDYQYQPLQNTVYQWTGGITGTSETKTYSYRRPYAFYGAWEFDPRDKETAVLEKEGKLSISTSPSDNDGKNMTKGVVIGVDNSMSQYNYSSSTVKHVNSYGRSDLNSDSESNGFFGWLLGYGDVYYSWSESTNSDTTTTYKVRADSPIGVGFANGATGQITVASGGSIKLMDNITNANKTVDNVKQGIGSVTLNAATEIYAEHNATINSDQFSVTAGNGQISVTQAAIGTTATGELVAKQGDITFTSTKGDISFSNVEGENVNLTTSGNLLTTDSGKITGEVINLTSNHGAIAANTDFNGNVAVNYVSATAAGDVSLTNVGTRDLRIKEIVSNGGDVMLDSGKGRIVDAVGNSILSNAEENVQRWLDFGLISAADSDDSNTEISKQTKSELLQNAEDALTKLSKDNSEAGHTVEYYKNAATVLKSGTVYAQYQNYQTALKAARETSLSENDTAIYTEALNTYNTNMQQLFAQNGYTLSSEEINAVCNYQAIDANDNYGWSKNDLLYALQASVVQSTPGQIVTVDKSNITGNNVTLKGAGVGIDADAVTISKADLSKVENLQLLANSKAGDLTWNDDGSVTVRQQQAVTVDMASGSDLTVETTGNVYLAGVKNTQLKIKGSITSDANVKLMADNGISMTEGSSISGNNLIAYGGSGDVGSAAVPLEVNMTGTIDANTDMNHSIYLKSTTGAGTMTVQNIIGGNVDLLATNNILMSDETGKNMGYIEANTLKLVSTNGSIGIINSTTEDEYDKDYIRLNNSTYNAYKSDITALAPNGDVYINYTGQGMANIVEGKAGNNFDVKSTTGFTGGNVTAGKDIYLQSQNSVTLNNLSAGNDLMVLQVNGTVTLNNVTAKSLDVLNNGNLIRLSNFDADDVFLYTDALWGDNKVSFLEAINGVVTNGMSLTADMMSLRNIRQRNGANSIFYLQVNGFRDITNLNSTYIDIYNLQHGINFYYGQYRNDPFFFNMDSLWLYKAMGKLAPYTQMGTLPTRYYDSNGSLEDLMWMGQKHIGSNVIKNDGSGSSQNTTETTQKLIEVKPATTETARNRTANIFEDD